MLLLRPGHQTRSQAPTKGQKFEAKECYRLRIGPFIIGIGREHPKCYGPLRIKFSMQKNNGTMVTRLMKQ